MRALVNPSILVWSREQSGLEDFEVARKIKVGREKLLAWEKGEDSMSIAQLEKIAQVYQRPTAFFYLPKAPVEPQNPKDFRTIGSTVVGDFSRDVRLAFRRAREIQHAILELEKDDFKKLFQRPFTLGITDDVYAAVKKARAFLDIQFKDQVAESDERALLKKVKTTLESKGIFVLQTPLSVNELRGFSLFSKTLPSIIMVSSGDSPSARIFSILHEFCHLLLGEDGVCDMGMRSDGAWPSKVEVFCNAFSAEFLVPKENFLLALKRLPDDVSEWTDKQYRQCASLFKVSKEVVLRRLLVTGLISKDHFEEKMSSWNEQRKNSKKQDSEFGIPQDVIALSRNGYSFSGLVMNAVSSGDITSSSAARILRLKVKNFESLKKGIAQSRI